MKTKFKETIEKCDSLEQRLNDLLKEKQSVERKWVPLPGLVPCGHESSGRWHPKGKELCHSWAVLSYLSWSTEDAACF